MISSGKTIGIGFLVASLLFSCKGDGTLLGLYPAEPIVNPDVRALIQGNRIVYACLDERNQIRGITEKGSFSTSNRFKSFSFNPSSWLWDAHTAAFGEGLLVYAAAEGTSVVLRHSSDMGATWQVHEMSIGEGDDLISGTLSVVQLVVGPDGALWVLAEYHAGMDIRMLLYHVNLDEASHELVLKRNNAIALAIDFADYHSGWLLYRERYGPHDAVRVLKTVNGGQAWSEGAVLGHLNQPAIEAIASDVLLVYPQTGQPLYSTDGGDSFVPVPIGENGIKMCYAASPRVVYALLADGVAKSTDAGQTWIRLEGRTHGIDVSGMAMDFYNERRGIIYDWNKLFITDDGGESWDILVYPYDYLFE
ncbi:hypothetical protein SAMN05660226_01543 [Parapedobacter luteus]|uniref:BNR/Asp-box repeat-containing protein n=1 Tax=Parapedobacter luteus TaxID=623280 RepID=A0A1T5BK15_9SPHI|nr:hypothetical protein [Parapedobacter luteus]SKB47621.1 hypothetical protein SAMN05660226_01543 [Parapedobacter luteus]